MNFVMFTQKVLVRLPLFIHPCYDCQHAHPPERILVVENDPDVIDLIARQTLQAMDFRVEISQGAPEAIQQAARYSPDVIIANLNLPGLSGKDLLVALNSQGLEIPVIVLAQKGMEADIIQAFRLGASDYLLWPVREAEVVSAVERVLKQVRSRREREALARQVKQTNEELHRRVRELTTIFAVGKAVTSITDQSKLFEKILEGAVYVTEADSGWLLLRSEQSKVFNLAAHRNLPKVIADKIGLPWDDGISSLVALSGESLSIHGSPLARFKISNIGQSALIVPLKVRKEVIGILVVIRKEAKPFSPSNQTLLEAVADYASISLVNAQLFHALEDKAQSLQKAVEMAQSNERSKELLILRLQGELKTPLDNAIITLQNLLLSEESRLNAAQKGVLRSAQAEMKRVGSIIANYRPGPQK